MPTLLSRLSLSYGQKLSLLATLPLILAVAAISVLVADQSRQLAEGEIRGLEEQLIETKKGELRNYLTQARNGFHYVYGNAAPDDQAAKDQVTQILSAMIYGQDGFFFVYDWDGTNLVSPRQTEMINRNWAGLTDSQGTPVVDRLIELARFGAGYHTYMWPKPSTGVEAQMVTYVVGFPSWRWAVGTGVFIDDVIDTVASARAEVAARIQRTFLYIGAITLGALVMVFLSGMILNTRERRLADEKLKKLTQRVFDTQEEERGRVARELHDGISQVLVAVRYTLELARRRIQTGDARAGENLDKGISSLNAALQEVRRISRDLRPAVLDDLGLGPALRALTEEFSDRTGIAYDFQTAVFRNRMASDAKIALYRIAQEALTNIERHSSATEISVTLFGHKNGITLRISDNGCGLPDKNAATSLIGGLGLRNMQERIDQLDGTLDIHSKKGGTKIEARIPLSHMLAPENQSKRTLL